METVAVVLMTLVCFNFMLKQTFLKPRSIGVISFICALFVGLMWPYAIEQSKSQISDWLSDSALMLDVAVILTLEVAVQMAFCLLSVHIQTSEKVSHRTMLAYRFLRWFPGVLIFPVLFSMLVSAIFALPGVSFPVVAWSLAGVVLVILTGGTYCMKRLLPEKEIRLELLFLLNSLIAVLGVIATVNGRTAVVGISEVDWTALAGVVLFVVLGFIFGIFSYHIKLNRTIKKNEI